MKAVMLPAREPSAHRRWGWGPSDTNKETIRSLTGSAFPVPLVCPACLGALSFSGRAPECVACHRSFEAENGFLDLIIGERFPDVTDEASMLYEEQSNADLARNYLIPLFGTLFPRRDPPPRLLSLGCGTGLDVDVLCDEGYDCVGIDCGNRTAVWPRRRHADRLLLANGKRLPFEDETFDGVFSGCVFPHVGVEGDTYRVTADYGDERLALAREMSRVLKPGGTILVSSPNRWFPFDIFHGRIPGSYRPRPYWPRDPFLLSLSDYRRLFRASGCARVRAQPVVDYWSFCRSQHSVKGRLLALPVRFLFWMASRERLPFLRSWAINPWLVVIAEKEPSARAQGERSESRSERRGDSPEPNATGVGPRRLDNDAPRRQEGGPV